MLLKVKQLPQTREKSFRVIQWSDLLLWTFLPGTLIVSVVRSDCALLVWGTDSKLLEVKQPTETREKPL